MNLDAVIREAAQRLKAQTDEHFDRLMIRNKFIFEHARRSSAARLRHDGREQRERYVARRLG